MAEIVKVPNIMRGGVLKRRNFITMTNMVKKKKITRVVLLAR